MIIYGAGVVDVAKVVDDSTEAGGVNDVGAGVVGNNAVVSEGAIVDHEDVGVVGNVTGVISGAEVVEAGKNVVGKVTGVNNGAAGVVVDDK